MKEEFYKFIKELKRIIQINRSKIPKHFLRKDYFGMLTDDLDKDVYNTSMLHTKYIDFLIRFGKFINEYEIDNTQIKKPILDKSKEYCRLKRLPREIVFSEDEITYENSEDEDSEEDDNTYEDSEDEDNSDNEESKELTNNLKKFNGDNEKPDNNNINMIDLF